MADEKLLSREFARFEIAEDASFKLLIAVSLISDIYTYLVKRGYKGLGVGDTNDTTNYVCIINGFTKSKMAFVLNEI
jgi:hypothetical protein